MPASTAKTMNVPILIPPGVYAALFFMDFILHVPLSLQGLTNSQIKPANSRNATIVPNPQTPVKSIPI